MRNTRRKRPYQKRWVKFLPLTTVVLVCSLSLWHHSQLEALHSKTAATTIMPIKKTDVSAVDASKQRRRRGRRLDSFAGLNHTIAPVTVPLHASSGTHHVQMYIGSPPQRQTLIIDTGSRLMAFPCEPCRSCGSHASKKYFDPVLSTTDNMPTCGSCMLEGISKCSEFSTVGNVKGVKNKKCIISQKYTEGSSWTAYELEDLVWMGASDHKESIGMEYMKMAVPYVFGCQTSEKGLFRKQYADGILGLAIHESSLVQALYDARSINRLAFSLCLTRTGGSLSAGGIATEERHLEPIRFTPIARDHGWFALTVERVLLGSVCLAGCYSKDASPSSGVDYEDTVLEAFHGGKGTILDSGTTDTYLPQAIAERFQKVWSRLTVGLHYARRKYKYSYAEYEKLPSISFQFANNVTLTVDPESYMESVSTSTTLSRDPWEGTRELVNRIYIDEPTGAVLGANTMLGHDILFDIQGKQVGLAKADCDSEIYHGVVDTGR
mmetsp:Transcript_23948/g.36230  ORF Transcript_23948/g.36230 Transcript_23948/m.36230 type:complete len:493 (+) Transcript_23948:51-1529(+)